MTLEQLDLELDRLEAAEACRNIIGRMMFYHTAGHASGLLALWSQRGDEELVTANGRLTGFDRISRSISNRCGGSRAGIMDVHQACTEVFTVSDDGDSAHGIWLSLGFRTAPAPGGGVSRWVWDKLSADFIRTPDGWRINRLWVYPVLDTLFGKSFAAVPPRYPVHVGGVDMWAWGPDRFYPHDQPPVPPLE